MDNYYTFRPKLREEIAFGPRERKGTKDVYFVNDRYTDQFYRIGEKEHFLLSRMDGRLSLAQLGETYAEHFGRQLDQRSWEGLFKLLHARQMLSGQADPTRLDELRERSRKKKLEEQGWLFKRFRLLNPDRLLGRILPFLRFCFSPYFVLPALAAILFVEASVFYHLSEIVPEAFSVRAHPGAWAVMIGLLVISAVVHEFGHGLACKRFGGTVNDMGIMWRYFWFYPYCKLDYIVLFHNRWHRVYVAFAGPFASLLLVVLYGVVWWAAPEASIWQAIGARMLLVYNVITLLNFIPFVQLDGYFMLCHALRLSELRQESHQYVKRALRRWLLRDATAVNAGYALRERWIYGSYGVLSVLTTYGLSGLMMWIWYNIIARRAGGQRALLIMVLLILILVMRKKGALWLGKLWEKWRSHGADGNPMASKV